MYKTVWAIAVFLAVSQLLFQPLFAEENAQSTTLEDLRKKIEQLDEKHAAEIEDLQQQIEALEERASRSGGPAQSPTAQRLNIFNPRITAFGNFIGRFNNQDAFTEDGDLIHDGFNLREVEIDFRAAIDPWADGVIVTTFEAEVPNEYEVEIEEGYLTLKKLPVLDKAPWGLKVKAGRFRPEFGRLNQIHTHDLPQTTRPMSFQTFLGEEGFIQNGLSGLFFIPTPGENNTFESTLMVLNGGGIPVAEENGGADPAFLGHLKWFWDLAPGHDLELGSSYYLGKADPAGVLETQLYGLDLTYKWKPFGRGEWRSFLIGGELFAADIDQSAGGSVTPLGYYAWSQYQFTRRTYLGARYDFTESLSDEELESRTFGAFLSYYTTEFLRLRFGYEHTTSDVKELDGLDTAFLEVNFVFGSHPVEPYWVSR
jgi:hypothetical protein